MATIGFIKSTMPDEKRVAMLPESLSKVNRPSMLIFEKGYASQLGISDAEYASRGASIMERSQMRGADIICVPKRWATDSDVFRQGHTLWGWAYAADTQWLANLAVEKEMTVTAFEYMHNEGAYVFEQNRRITGIAGILQSIAYAGKPPETLSEVAILGRGNVAKGVFEIFNKLGVKYQVFHTGNISDFFSSLPKWEVIVNAIKWDRPGEYFITSENISSMRNGALLIDLTSEGVEGSTPQPVLSPVYEHRNVLIYNNEHIPTIWAKYASQTIGEALVPFINDLVDGRENRVLLDATVVFQGKVVDQRIYSLIRPSIPKTGTYG